jgi:predicted Zn-dependent protease
MLVPSDELTSMGEAAFQQIKREQPVEKEMGTTQYVRCVAMAVAELVPDGPSNWEVVVFEDDTPNAFALPGGKIGVHTGLLKIAKTQDQLAAVLGHEIAHVTQGHSNERVSQAFVAEGGLKAASLALGGGGTAHDVALGALGLGAQYGVLMPFSRAQESEADVVGLEYMARAGFDPRGAVALWKNMAAAGDGAPPEFLSTHPADESRIANLESRMPSASATYRASGQGESPRCQGARDPVSRVLSQE